MPTQTRPAKKPLAPDRFPLTPSTITIIATAVAIAGVTYALLTSNRLLLIAVIDVYMALMGVGAFYVEVRHHHQVIAAVRAAYTDKLTGLPTRPVMDDLLDAATRDQLPVTVAVADADGLHWVNATFGHAGGDQYLTEVARRLTRALPAGGTVVRQGGDEFTLLVPGTISPAQLATMIGSALAGPATVGGQHLQPRASVGIHAGTGNAWHILACADAAMYTAKETGGNHILTYDADRDGIPATDGTRPASRTRDQQPAWTPSITPWAATSAPVPAVRTPAYPGRPHITLYWSARVSYSATFDLAELTDLTQLSHPDGSLDLDMLTAAPAEPRLCQLLADHETPLNSDGVQERQIATVEELPVPPAD
jgi:diguanylate cyclase (GGDEF)-like protein